MGRTPCTPWSSITSDGRSMPPSADPLSLAYDGHRVVAHGPYDACKNRLHYLARTSDLTITTARVASGVVITGVTERDQADTPEPPMHPCPLCGMPPIVQDYSVFCDGDCGIFAHRVAVTIPSREAARAAWARAVRVIRGRARRT